MKIAFALFKYFPYGGLQLDTVRFLAETARRGHQAVLFVCEINGALPEIAGVRVVELPVSAASNHGMALAFEKKFHEAVRSAGDFDVTVAMNRIRGCDFYFAADNCLAVEYRKKHSPLVLKLLPRYRTFLQLEKGIFAPDSKTKIFYIAPPQLEDFTEVYNTEKDRFIPLPPGIPEKYRGVRADDEARKIIRKNFNIADDKIILISIGANFKLKGFDRAIEVLASLPAALREKIVWLAVGPDENKAIRAQAEQKGIAHIFAGARNDTPQLISGSDLMIHLPRSEAAGSVIVEALSCHIPVLCTGNCGFAPYAEAAGCPVVPGGYEHDIAVKLCCDMLTSLERYKEQLAVFSKETDFFGRSAKAVEVMEKFVRHS